MSTQVQYRRGSNVQVAAFTGALGELVIDTTNKIVVVNDGVTVGGFPQVGLTATQTLTNKTLSAPVFSGNANIVGNIVGAGAISLTGNVTAAYLFGNAACVTGLSASSISSGTSNVNVVSSGGNVTIGIGGTANVVQVASTGEYVTGVISATGNIVSSSYIQGANILATGWIANPNTLSANVSVPTGYNALAAGPITVDTGIVVTIASGSTMTIF